jgi:hypothetical protein
MRINTLANRQGKDKRRRILKMFKSISRRAVSLVLTLAVALSLAVVAPLTASAANETEPNDDYGTATVIRLDETVQANFALVPNSYQSSNGSETDWYKVSLPQSGSMKLHFSKPADFDVDVRVSGVNQSGALTELYCMNLFPLENPVVEYSKQDSDNIYLPAGDYYIQAYGSRALNGGKTDYTMTVSFSAILDGAMELEPNNEYKSATRVSINAPIKASFPNTHYSGYAPVHKTDDMDWYKFTLAQQGNLQVLFNRPAGRTFNVRLHRVEPNGELREISSSDFVAIPNTVNDYITETNKNIGLAAGEYYAQVYSGESIGLPTDYTIAFVSLADSPSNWALEQIVAAIHAKLVPQQLQSKFTQATTRAEFCRLTVNFLRQYGYDVDSVTPKLFADTSDKDIGIAAALGVTSGTDTAKNLFSPNQQLTREQAATMLRNVLNVIGANTMPPPGILWTDEKDIANWAKAAVDVMYGAKVMGGTSATALVFDPKASYTREMAIITIQNLWEYAHR